MPEEYQGPGGEGLDLPPPFFPSGREDLEPDDRKPVRVALEGIYKSEAIGGVQHFVRLEGGGRSLSIVVGGFEAQAILLPIQEVKSDRPMTHDLLRNVIDRLGAEVESVTIDDLWNDVYYARIHLYKAGERFAIDSRPSDAIAMAVRFDAPLSIAERVFDIAERYEEE